MKKLFTFLFLIPVCVLAQGNQPNAAEIQHRLQKLNFLGSAMMVAAHPDDENTNLITWLANDKLATTAYFAMTRGDGGQNLIGSEIRDLLGLIRTEELMAARKIDGGEQFFTRANDFGFSKEAPETFEIWEKDEILSDVVRVIRRFKPDVVINRFPPTPAAGHGHHQGSAILSIEAYDLVGNAQSYPASAQEFGVWQPTRLFMNGFGGGGRGGRGGPPPQSAPQEGRIVINTGGYNPLLGTSYGEISALSRSQHKTQGFGRVSSRGDQFDALEVLKGKALESNDIFSGINTTWSRLKGGEKVQPMVDKAISEFNIANPAASVPALVQIYKTILTLEDGVWKDRKLADTEQLIKDCLGLYIEVAADANWVAPGDRVRMSFELVNRSGVEVSLERIMSTDVPLDTAIARSLTNNNSVEFSFTKAVPANKQYSDPYWLKEDHPIGHFNVSDTKMLGLPENHPAVNYQLRMRVAGEPIVFNTPVVFKRGDRVEGEVTEPFEIVPAVLVNVAEDVMIFNDGAPRTVNVTLVSATPSSMKGDVKLQLPQGWRSEPASATFELTTKGAEQTRTFRVIPPANESTGELTAVAIVNGKTYNQEMHHIAYSHIPTQLMLPKAQAHLARLNLKKEGSVIGYIAGAGDEVPAALRIMGYEVWEMKNEEVTAENLKRVDAVVTGVRALNTNDRIMFMAPVLLDYVKNGGTMVVQYNTSTQIGEFAPYNINISRDRVTEEDAEVKFIDPNHPLLNSPNKITASDFDGWVQERGLYYPSQWGPEFKPVLSMHDKGESDLTGSLLVADYGSGKYIYTGLSFFRELPAGVPGAYKLFSNLVSAGKKPGGTSLQKN